MTDHHGRTPAHPSCSSFGDNATESDAMLAPLTYVYLAAPGFEEEICHAVGECDSGAFSVVGYDSVCDAVNQQCTMQNNTASEKTVAGRQINGVDLQAVPVFLRRKVINEEAVVVDVRATSGVETKNKLLSEKKKLISLLHHPWALGGVPYVHLWSGSCQALLSATTERTTQNSMFEQRRSTWVRAVAEARALRTKGVERSLMSHEQVEDLVATAENEQSGNEQNGQQLSFRVSVLKLGRTTKSSSSSGSTSAAATTRNAGAVPASPVHLPATTDRLKAVIAGNITRMFPSWKVDLSVDCDVEIVAMVHGDHDSTCNIKHDSRSPLVDLVLNTKKHSHKRHFEKLPSEWRCYHFLQHGQGGEKEEQHFQGTSNAVDKPEQEGHDAGESRSPLGMIEAAPGEFPLPTTAAVLEEEITTPGKKDVGKSCEVDAHGSLPFRTPATQTPPSSPEVVEKEISASVLSATKSTPFVNYRRLKQIAKEVNRKSNKQNCNSTTTQHPMTVKTNRNRKQAAASKQNKTFTNTSTLRPSTAYLLLKAAKCPKAGNFRILDSMGGQGTIACEAVLQFPNVEAVTVDADPEQTRLAEICSKGVLERREDIEKYNCSDTTRSSSLTCYTGDARNVSTLLVGDGDNKDGKFLNPFDFVVVDLPFGNNHGIIGATSITEFLADFLYETAKVLKRDSGRCCLLCTKVHARQIRNLLAGGGPYASATGDHFSSSVEAGYTVKKRPPLSRFFQTDAVKQVGIGGWPAAVLVLQRTDAEFVDNSDEQQNKGATREDDVNGRNATALLATQEKQEHDTTRVPQPKEISRPTILRAELSANSAWTASDWYSCGQWHERGDDVAGTLSTPTAETLKVTDFLMQTWPEHFPTVSACRKTCKRLRVWREMVVENRTNKKTSMWSTDVETDNRLLQFQPLSADHPLFDRNTHSPSVELVDVDANQDDQDRICVHPAQRYREAQAPLQITTRFWFFPDYPHFQPYKSGSEVELLWENESFLAVQKPFGMAVHGGIRTVQNCVAALLMERRKKKLDDNEVHKPESKDQEDIDHVGVVVAAEKENAAVVDVATDRETLTIPNGVCLYALPDNVAGPILVAKTVRAAVNFHYCLRTRSSPRVMKLRLRAVVKCGKDHAEGRQDEEVSEACLQLAETLQKSATGKDNDGEPFLQQKNFRVHRTADSLRFGKIAEISWSDHVSYRDPKDAVEQAIQGCKNAGFPILGSSEETHVRKGRLLLVVEDVSFSGFICDDVQQPGDAGISCRGSCNSSSTTSSSRGGVLTSTLLAEQSLNYKGEQVCSFSTTSGNNVAGVSTPVRSVERFDKLFQMETAVVEHARRASSVGIQEEHDEAAKKC
ncbi:unnamed protein product [Amoebophrya sp. A120]|nr:unnamed protein product [Amoebophrya sp. A120]|eukprot:GSA120T00012023001.1